MVFAGHTQKGARRRNTHRCSGNQLDNQARSTRVIQQRALREQGAYLQDPRFLFRYVTH